MMRTLTFLMVSAALATGAAGPVSAMAASGTIVLQATATFSDGTTADRLYAVVSAADLDGDGVMDQGWLRVACTQGSMSAVYYAAASPRDSASGMPTGKRQHGSVTITKEWGASTLSFGKTGGGGGGGAVGSTVSWDLVKGKGSRSTGSGPAQAAVKHPYNIKENKPSRVAADDGSGARGHWDLAEAKPLRVAADGGGSGGSDGKTMATDSWHSGMTLVGKTMAHDSWTTVVLTEGSPNLCD